MTPRGFFDCLDVAAAEQRQAQAQAVEVEVEVEPVDDQSTDADPAAEVAAFVDRPASPVIEATKPAARSGGNASSYGSSARSTPLAEAAGFYGTGSQ